MHKQRTTTDLIRDLSLKLWEYHWKVKCEVKNCEVCELLGDAKEMNEPGLAQRSATPKRVMCSCPKCSVSIEAPGYCSSCREDCVKHPFVHSRDCRNWICRFIWWVHDPS